MDRSWMGSGSAFVRLAKGCPSIDFAPFLKGDSSEYILDGLATGQAKSNAGKRTVGCNLT